MPALHLRHIVQFIAVALVTLNTSLNAQASFIDDYMIDPDDGMFDTSQYLSEVPMGFLPVPIIITEPAVGNGLGVVGVFFHESEEQKANKANKVSRRGRAVIPENISIVAFAGTENGSKAAALGHIGFWFEDNLRYQGFVLLPNINMDFYSIAGIELPRPIELNITGPAIIQNIKARINHSQWFVGFHQIYSEVTASIANNAIIETDFDIEIKTITSGLGLILEYDSRNNPMNAEKGYNYQLKATRFDEAIGSDINYDKYYFKGLNYWELSKSFNFALRLQFDEVSSEKFQPLPPYIAPSIDLRGVPAMRYQGKQVSVGEVELTWKMSQRWRFNTFTGTGRTGKDFDELKNAENINSYGVGFRYLIAKRYGFTMGTDVAKGPEDTVFYIQAGSSW